MGLKELANLAQGSKELRHHNSAENMVLKVPIIRKQIGLGPETNRYIKSIILEHGDEQQRRTNVKAIMTEWFMHKKHSVFNELCTQAIEFADKNSPHKVPLEPFDCWGNISYKGDWVKVHDHWPHVWSWCYYAQVSKECSPIFFPHTDNKQRREFWPEQGEMLLWPGALYHGVDPLEVDFERVVVAGNLTVKL